jgi:hypothetical protein
MPDTRIKIAVLRRGITIAEVVRDRLTRELPDSAGGTA